MNQGKEKQLVNVTYKQAEDDMDITYYTQSTQVFHLRQHVETLNNTFRKQNCHEYQLLVVLEGKGNTVGCGATGVLIIRARDGRPSLGVVRGCVVRNRGGIVPQQAARDL